MARQSSLDILRIIATFNVVWVHCSIFYRYSSLKKLPFFTIVTYIFSKTCNYLFMLISGYIGCFGTFRISHIFNLALETIFGSLTVGVVIQCFFLSFISDSSIRWSSILMPMAHNRYWYPAPFIFTQLLFYFIFPSAKQTPTLKYVKYSLIIIFLLFIQRYGFYKDVGLGSTRYNITSFIIAFLSGPLINKFKDKIDKYSILIFIVCFIYNYIIHYFAFPKMNIIISMFLECNLFEIPSFLLSVSMLLLSLNIKSNIPYGNILQTIAELSYGIYLLGLGAHMGYYWNIRMLYINDMRKFTHVVFLLSIKSFICLGIIALVQSKFLKLLIYRRSYYSTIKYYLDS